VRLKLNRRRAVWRERDGSPKYLAFDSHLKVWQLFLKVMKRITVTLVIFCGVALGLSLVTPALSDPVADRLGGLTQAAVQNMFAPVPKTGLINSYGTGDDGALQKGIPLPSPRFIDNGNGTVTDLLTGLIWLKNAGAFAAQNWATALNAANNLASGNAGLTDGSMPGDWRLPNVRELQSLVDYGQFSPVLGTPFTNVHSNWYWTSSTDEESIVHTGVDRAWAVNFNAGAITGFPKTDNYYVLCVRGGQPSSQH
jgi:hypothetical protein